MYYLHPVSLSSSAQDYHLTHVSISNSIWEYHLTLVYRYSGVLLAANEKTAWFPLPGPDSPGDVHWFSSPVMHRYVLGSLFFQSLPVACVVPLWVCVYTLDVQPLVRVAFLQ